MFCQCMVSLLGLHQMASLWDCVPPTGLHPSEEESGRGATLRSQAEIFALAVLTRILLPQFSERERP